MQHRALRFLAILVLFVTAPAIRAHDPGLSALTVKVEPVRITARLTLARADVESVVPLDVNHDGRISDGEFQAAQSALRKVADTALEVILDGLASAASQTTLELDPSDAVHFQFSFPREAALELNVRSSLIHRLPRGHRQFFSLRDSGDRLLGEKMLDANNDWFIAKLSPPTAAELSNPSTPSVQRRHSFGRFLLLGVEHIATGYDHLVFLLGLLIVGGSFRDVLKIVTSFTIAHSITLALATLNLIRLSSNIVEPLIAASIMYVGLENIFRRDLNRRWMLTFFFGLVHGCGFASALRELGIGSDGGGVVLPLVSFNLGVELGQLVLAAIVLPIVWQLKKRPQYVPRCVPACSVLIALAGGYWLVQRVLPFVAH